MSARARAPRTDTDVIGANVSVRQFLAPEPASAYIGPKVHSTPAKPEGDQYYDAYLAETFKELWERIRDNPVNYRQDIDALVEAYRQDIEDDLDRQDDLDPDREDVRAHAATMRAFQTDLQQMAETYVQLQAREREESRLKVQVINEHIQHSNDIFGMIDMYVQRCNVRIREWSATTVHAITALIAQLYNATEAATIEEQLRSGDAEQERQSATQLFTDHPQEFITAIGPQMDVWFQIHTNNVEGITSGVVGNYLPSDKDIEEFERDVGLGHMFLERIRTKDEMQDAIFFFDLARDRLAVARRINAGSDRILTGTQHHFNLVMKERYDKMTEFHRGEPQQRKAVNAAKNICRWLFRQNLHVAQSSAELTEQIDYEFAQLFDKRVAAKQEAEEELRAKLAHAVEREYTAHQVREQQEPDPMLTEKIEEFRTQCAQFLQVPNDPDDFTDSQADEITDYAEELLDVSTETMREAIANLLYARTDTTSRLLECKRKHRLERAQARLRLALMNAQPNRPRIVFAGL